MQAKINLQSFKSTPDSLKQHLKAFDRKRSLGAPDPSGNYHYFPFLRHCFFFFCQETIYRKVAFVKFPFLVLERSSRAIFVQNDGFNSKPQYQANVGL